MMLLIDRLIDWSITYNSWKMEEANRELYEVRDWSSTVALAVEVAGAAAAATEEEETS